MIAADTAIGESRIRIDLHHVGTGRVLVLDADALVDEADLEHAGRTLGDDAVFDKVAADEAEFENAVDDLPGEIALLFRSTAAIGVEAQGIRILCQHTLDVLVHGIDGEGPARNIGGLERHHRRLVLFLITDGDGVEGRAHGEIVHRLIRDIERINSRFDHRGLPL